MKLTEENIEEQILLLVDGELKEEAAEAVMSFIQQHTVYQAMLDAYTATRDQPDETVVFPGKESLLREEPKAQPLRRIFSSRLRWSTAAAILVAIIAGTAFWWSRPAAEEPARMAAQKKDILVNTVAQDAANNNNPVSQTRPAHTHTLTQTTSVHPRIAKVKIKTTVQSQVVVAAAVPDVAEQHKRKLIAPMAAVPAQTTIAIAAVPAPALVAVPERQAYAASHQSEEPADSWSPIKEETREGLSELAAQFRTIKTDVQEKAQLLRNARIVLRIGDKDIALNKKERNKSFH